MVPWCIRGSRANGRRYRLGYPGGNRRCDARSATKIAQWRSTMARGVVKFGWTTKI
jgi:hypothetical protein